MQEFATYLKKIREAKGMTVNQLAMYSGISAAQLSRMENGKRGVPKPATLRKLADALKIEYTELMKMAGYLANTSAYAAAENKVMVVMEHGSESPPHKPSLETNERIVLQELRKYPEFLDAIAAEPTQIKRLVKMWKIMKEDRDQPDD